MLGALAVLHVSGGHQALFSIPGATAEPRRIARGELISRAQTETSRKHHGERRNAPKRRQGRKGKTKPAGRARQNTQDEDVEGRRGKGRTEPRTRSRSGKHKQEETHLAR